MVVSSASATRRPEAQDLAHDQHGPLVGRQELQRRDEGQLDRLALLVAGVGRVEAVLHGEGLVRVGLHPHRLDHRLAGAVMRVRGGAVVHGEHPLGALRDRVEAGVGGDPVEPGAQGAAALEPRQAAPGPQERLLERVLGIVHRSQHPVAVRVKLAVAGADQPLERGLVAAPGRPPAARDPGRLVVSRAHALTLDPRRGFKLIGPPMNSPRSFGRYGQDEVRCLKPSRTPRAPYRRSRAGMRVLRRRLRMAPRAGSGRHAVRTGRLNSGASVGGGVVECATTQSLWLPYVEVPDVALPRNGHASWARPCPWSPARDPSAGAAWWTPRRAGNWRSGSRNELLLR